MLGRNATPLPDVLQARVSEYMHIPLPPVHAIPINAEFPVLACLNFIQEAETNAEKVLIFLPTL